MTRRIAKGGDEEDVFSQRARNLYLWTQRPGVCKKIKRKANRRDRRETRQALRRGSED